MIEGEVPLSDAEFDRLKARVYAQAGISLSDAKRTLVVSRLSKIMRALHMDSFEAYLDFLERQPDTAHAQDFINALTTNLTRFFREEHHFHHLCDHVGELMRRQPRRGTDGRPRLRIWSAGCSTGQEAYSIALSLLTAHPELAGWDFRILATDIDTSVIARAAEGVFPESELAGLTPSQAGLFERAGDRIRVPEAARRCIAFKPLNLMAPEWPMRGPFDAIFCRNVAIYFDRQTQGQLFARLGRMLAPSGFLYIGHSENLGAGSEGFTSMGRTIHQLSAAPRSRSAA